MNKLAQLRTDLLSDHVQQLADTLRKKNAMAHAYAGLIAKGSSGSRIFQGKGDTICGLCGQRYDSHAQWLGLYVLCNGCVAEL